MKIKSPVTFRNKYGEIVLQGAEVDASAVKGFQTVTQPEPYETKVVRAVAADAPRAVTSESIAPAKVATKPAAKAAPAKAPRKTAKKK